MDDIPTIDSADEEILGYKKKYLGHDLLTLAFVLAAAYTTYDLATRDLIVDTWQGNLLMFAVATTTALQFLLFVFQKKTDIYLAGMTLLTLTFYLYIAADTQWGTFLTSQNLAWQEHMFAMSGDNLVAVCRSGIWLQLSNVTEEQQKWKDIYNERLAEARKSKGMNWNENSENSGNDVPSWLLPTNGSKYT